MPIGNGEEVKNKEIFIPYSWKRSPVKCPPDPDEDVWGVEEKWILQFDNIIKHPGGRAKGCECEIHVSSWRPRGTNRKKRKRKKKSNYNENGAVIDFSN